MAALLLSACAVSGFSNPFKSSDAPLPVSQDGMLAEAKADAPQIASLANDSLHCPQIVAWPHDRLLTIYADGRVGDGQAIKHRGEITRLARQCQIYGDRVVVKYGFAGRVLLGPKGAPGQVTLPVSVKVADADPQGAGERQGRRLDHRPHGKSGRLFLHGQGDYLPHHHGHAA